MRTVGRKAVVKVRIAKLRSGSMGAPRAHLRYIQRDSVDRNGEPGKLYGPELADHGPGLRHPWHQAGQLLTMELGPEIEFDKQLKVAREVNAQHFTNLDRSILKHVDHGILSISPTLAWRLNCKKVSGRLIQTPNAN